MTLLDSVLYYEVRLK